MYFFVVDEGPLEPGTKKEVMLFGHHLSFELTNLFYEGF